MRRLETTEHKGVGVNGRTKEQKLTMENYWHVTQEAVKHRKHRKQETNKKPKPKNRKLTPEKHSGVKTDVESRLVYIHFISQYVRFNVNVNAYAQICISINSTFQS